ncbi:Piso0_002573 [Millerozyma farinosa CBS 7064]|uniref:Chromosome segregation in meiosis protein n=1 Tax=Pichia sorbitophila (strain ATCC MYA-4447 / BCRC 22081 / CBS 7064 / NBRC 10061 / NRRL Y-12695) TaxID=559304 RepID=G8YCZ2_PICSO|nr:Piso0_002573 [Millerozyma farinosa CBS 7064]
MDLEEELSYYHQQEQAPESPSQDDNSGSVRENQNDDLLGLDQSIKLTTRAKIAKIDEERIFNKQKGIHYIIQNHRKLEKIFERNENRIWKKYRNHSLSSDMKKQIKHEVEYENMTSMLQFYQLWCHGLFPKARFRDCIQMLRAFGSKSSQLKLYRRELVEREIYKAKVESGLEPGSPEPSNGPSESAVSPILIDQGEVGTQEPTSHDTGHEQQVLEHGPSGQDANAIENIFSGSHPNNEAINNSGAFIEQQNDNAGKSVEVDEEPFPDDDAYDEEYEVMRELGI